jgi:hypothetical protein
MEVEVSETTEFYSIISPDDGSISSFRNVLILCTA